MPTKVDLRKYINLITRFFFVLFFYRCRKIAIIASSRLALRI